MIQILGEYISIRGGESDDYLFCTIYGEKLKKDSVKTAIYRYNKNHDVEKTSIHLFRHTFSKKWIMSGGDPFRLQKILGHKSMRIVKEYINLYSNDLKENFNKFNPLEEFNNNGEYIEMDQD